MSQRAYITRLNEAVKNGRQVDTLGAHRIEEDNEYIFVSGVASCAVNDAVAILEDYSIVRLTETEAAKGRRIGVAQSAIVNGYYGWVQIRGVSKVNCALNCAKDSTLYATTTAGVLDDAGTTSINGIVATETITTAAPAACLLNYPDTMG
jgi:hypothetical protein